MGGLQVHPQPFFRPPWGSQTATTVKAAGDSGDGYVVMWNGDAGDWRGPSASRVAANALAARQAGSDPEGERLKAVSLTQLRADAGLPYWAPPPGFGPPSVALQGWGSR